MAFPTSVVDRMVPATTDADLEEVGRLIGLDDQGAVVAEGHRSWVISDAEGLPPLSEVGVEVVSDTAPYEARKLSLLNGPHSALAYCGLLAGCRTISEAATHPVVGAYVARLTDQIVEVADVPAGLHPAAFAADSLHRFENRALRHLCTQVGADGSRKLEQRLLPVVAARIGRGADTARFAVVVGVWLAALSGIAVGGVVLPDLDDPAGEDVKRAASPSRCDPAEVCRVALGARWPRPFCHQVAATISRLSEEGECVMNEPA